MELRFDLIQIDPLGDLGDKLIRLDTDPRIDRILADIIIEIKTPRNETIELQGFIDTGAIFTLLPGKILDDFPNLQTEPHTMWEVINKQECKFRVELGKIQIRFKDKDDQISQPIDIIAAFAMLERVPILLGMKNLLSILNFSYNKDQKVLSIFLE